MDKFPEKIRVLVKETGQIGFVNSTPSWSGDTYVVCVDPAKPDLEQSYKQYKEEELDYVDPLLDDMIALLEPWVECSKEIQKTLRELKERFDDTFKPRRDEGYW